MRTCSPRHGKTCSTIGVPFSSFSMSRPTIRAMPRDSESPVRCTRQCAANSLSANASARLAPLLLLVDRPASSDSSFPAWSDSSFDSSESSLDSSEPSLPSPPLADSAASSCARTSVLGSSAHGGWSLGE
eukprot:scaffold49569_cov69-Phaeocystis_antarctica.AAC.4